MNFLKLLPWWSEDVSKLKVNAPLKKKKKIQTSFPICSILVFTKSGLYLPSASSLVPFLPHTAAFPLRWRDAVPAFKQTVSKSLNHWITGAGTGMVLAQGLGASSLCPGSAGTGSCGWGRRQSLQCVTHPFRPSDSVSYYFKSKRCRESLTSLLFLNFLFLTKCL